MVAILGGHELELVHNHHNFAWKETHDGEELVVVRKGATPAFPGQKGFIGGSMGDDAVIVQGRRAETPTATDAAARGAVLHRARRGPRDVAHRGGGQAQPEDRARCITAGRGHAGDDGGVGRARRA